ncbi:hypothetical protein K0038_02454 [Pseudomonas syringae]|nr:hypothetical protein [Pseudomonas syringae]
MTLCRSGYVTPSVTACIAIQGISTKIVNKKGPTFRLTLFLPPSRAEKGNLTVEDIFYTD